MPGSAGHSSQSAEKSLTICWLLLSVNRTETILPSPADGFGNEQMPTARTKWVLREATTPISGRKIKCSSFKGNSATRGKAKLKMNENRWLPLRQRGWTVQTHDTWMASVFSVKEKNTHGCPSTGAAKKDSDEGLQPQRHGRSSSKRTPALRRHRVNVKKGERPWVSMVLPADVLFSKIKLQYKPLMLRLQGPRDDLC